MLLTYHPILCLLVGGDAERDRENSRREDEGIVGSGLFGDEDSREETCYDGQTSNDGEDHGHDVEDCLRCVA